MKKGFTLSEVLITLAVLGVVAAMTIPVVSGNTREAEFKAKAKKTYSVLTQAFAMASLQGYSPVHTAADGDATNIIQWFEKYLSPNLSLIKKCTDLPTNKLEEMGQMSWFPKGQCWHEGHTNGLNGKRVYCSETNSIGNGVVQAVLNDGTFINMDSYGSGSMNTYFGQEISGAGIVLFFDVNGSKKPNVLGKDIYVAVYHDGGLAPAYVSKTDQEAESECSAKHSGPGGAGNGYACLKVIMNKALQ
jgi:prepilin-type N-terminal cleavage/methylation domain-containing protein